MRSLTQKINDHVVRIYERRRHRAYALRDQAVRSLYRQYPELEALDKALVTAGFARLQARLGQEAPLGPWSLQRHRKETDRIPERTGHRGGIRPTPLCLSRLSGYRPDRG